MHLPIRTSRNVIRLAPSENRTAGSSSISFDEELIPLVKERGFSWALWWKERRRHFLFREDKDLMNEECLNHADCCD